MAFDAVLFDLDGTLLNTLEDLTDSANFAMDAMGYPRHTLAEICSYINNGARRLILGASPEGTPAAEIDRCLQIFQTHYKGNLDNKTRPYPGILDALARLKALGVLSAVVSNKFDGAVKPLCAKYFGDLVCAAIGEDEAHGVRRKPAPDSVFAAMRALGAKNALYVGDTSVDIETAKNAFLPCLAVSWGFRPRESLVEAGALHIVDRVEDLVPAIVELGRQYV